ncbi:MAG: hypothetical protein AAFV80_18130, partial [Bacteroidota bacterium]
KVPVGSLRQPDKANKLLNASGPYPSTEKFYIDLYGYHSKNPRIKVPIIKTELLAADLVGKKIDLSFIKDLELGDYSIKTKHDFQLFTPQIALNGLNVEKSFLEDRSVLGDPITHSGEKIILNAENTDENYQAKFLPSNPDLLQQVETISVEVTAGNFPEVKLNIDALDKDGQFVEGLQATDFRIQEDGKGKRALMISNQRTPKILVLSDASLSMPSSYRGKGMLAFNAQLEANILEYYPGANIEFWETPSSLFTWLIKASQTNADLIIYATDGDNSDKFQESDRPVHQAGPPALILNVDATDSETKNETFELMAEVTNGQVLPAKDQEATKTAIVQYLNNLKISPYVFTYASANRHDRHTVAISLDKERVKTEAQYQFPAEATSRESGWIAIHAEIGLSYYRAFPEHRVLAGWDGRETYDPADNARFVHDVQGLLMGNLELYIEGEGPTLSTALTEFLQAKLTHQKWGEAYMEGDMEAAKEAIMEGGVYQLPGQILHLMMPLEDQVSKSHLTFPNGYRMAFSKFKVGFGDLPTSASFDYLATSRYSSITKNPAKAFDQTLEITTQLALREAILFEYNTNAVLIGKTLISSPNLRLPENKEILQPFIKNADYLYRKSIRDSRYIGIFDTQAETFAHWRINAATGELYGILPDGTGGGKNNSDISTEIGLLMDIVNTVDHAVSMVAGTGIFANPIGGLSLGIVAKYGITLVKLYAIVAEVIVIMDASGLEERIQKELQILACEVAKDILFAATGNAGKMMAGLTTLIGLMVPAEDNPFACK